ncbi:Rubrerythrin [Seinonella peptonophila]|uniref:Rubrerythrin n=1 Tax=Seinonella peptonophila TaxID=112248 RepID=A0A1M5AB44_9BACL|nr:ferritin-like domain-containing protein [Seinonella peptonophila]SHF27483.1 Rubrerythrin [Seinonella peptonophila]
MTGYLDPFIRGVDHHLLADIKKAIQGEYNAIHCYQLLAEQAPSSKERKQILEIREDEIKHYNQFINLYYRLTGKRLKPQVTESCPSNYLEGLKFSIEDEQETVDFYLEISDKAKESYIRKLFKRAAKDEQNHAVWFLYFYTKYCCKKAK